MKFSAFTKKLISTILSSSSEGDYYLVGHSEKINSEDNVKIPLGNLNVKMGEAILNSQTTYQNNDFIGITSSMITLNGFEIDGAGLLDNINTVTGTITFNTSQSGKLKYIAK